MERCSWDEWKEERTVVTLRWEGDLNLKCYFPLLFPTISCKRSLDMQFENDHAEWFSSGVSQHETNIPPVLEAFVRNTKTCWNSTPTILLFKPGHHSVSPPDASLLLRGRAAFGVMPFKRWIIVAFYRLILLLIFGPSCVGKKLYPFKQFRRDLQSAVAFLCTSWESLAFHLHFVLTRKKCIKNQLFSIGKQLTGKKCL